MPVNSDSAVEISDAVMLLARLCLDGQEPPCLDAADTNDDGCVDLRDFFLVPGFCPFNELDACRPAPPYPAPGPDPTLDYLGCASASKAR